MQHLILRLVYSVFLRWILRLIVGIKFEVPKFLIDEKQFVIIANHNSHMDTLAILSSLPGSIIHKVKPIAAADYFGKTKFQEKLSNFFVNTLLISREHGNAIELMKETLDKGFSLIIFPEGSRGEPGKEQSFRSGVAVLLSLCPNVKYVPAYLSGMGKIMPKGDSLIIPHNSSLIYGKPTLIQSTEVKDILTQIENDIRDLKN